MSASRGILLIDDDRDWLETLADYLGSKGFSVTLAEHAEEALQAIARPDLALAIVDYHLRGDDGLRLLAELRRRRNLPLLLVSGVDEPLLAARTRAAGGTAFVPKTSSPQFLLRVIEQALASGNPTAA
jgi:CheY-like chemotaxis protein